MFTDDPTQVRPLHVGHVAPNPTWRTAPGTHTTHELICVTRGRIHVGDGQRVQTGTAGTVCLYPAGALHEEWTDADAPLESLFIGFESPIPPDLGVLVLRDSRGRIPEMIRWLREDALAGRSLNGPGCRALLIAVLAELQRNLTEPSHSWVEQVRHHIRTHLAEPLTLATLARVAGLSRYHFVRAYKQATGVTPMADVRAIRVQHARQLILGTALPLKEIAELAGLGDVYAFSRIFRQNQGIPPGQLRRARE